MSDRFGLRVATSHPQIEGEVSLNDLRFIAIAMTGILSLALVAFALILRLRHRDNPVTELERALRHGEFVPYYQPIVDITNGRLRGAEVLMRWKKSDGTVLQPRSYPRFRIQRSDRCDDTSMMRRRDRGYGISLCGPSETEARV